MGDKKVCSSTIGPWGPYANKLEAWECAKETEREKKTPMSVMEFAEQGQIHYLVYEIRGCHENAVYDAYVGDNEGQAKACAEALTRITGQHHWAQRTQRRIAFSNVWDVWSSVLKKDTCSPTCVW